MRSKSVTGFTLIELMIIVAILGILTTIALPKFGKMIQKAYEGRGKGNLGALRSAMSIYYADNEGRYMLEVGIPAASRSLQPLVPLYIDEIPGAYTGQKAAWGKDAGLTGLFFSINPFQYHEGNNRSSWMPFYFADNDWEGEWFWMVEAPKIVWINCTLKDSHDNYVSMW